MKVDIRDEARVLYQGFTEVIKVYAAKTNKSDDETFSAIYCAILVFVGAFLQNYQIDAESFVKAVEETNTLFAKEKNHD